MFRSARSIAALAALTAALLLALAGVASSRSGDRNNADRGCVKSGPPKVHDASIKQHSVTVSIWYNDTCSLPAKSWIEFASAHNENWHMRARENTNPTSEHYWRERKIEIQGLDERTEYKVRSGVTYLYSDDVSSAVRFKTAGRTCGTACRTR